MAPHQIGHFASRDEVYLAAITGIIANPNFFGAIHQGSPSAAVAFASEVVSETFGDAHPAHEAGEVETLRAVLTKALADVEYQPGDHPVVPIKHDAFVKAVRAALEDKS